MESRRGKSIQRSRAGGKRGTCWVTRLQQLLPVVLEQWVMLGEHIEPCGAAPLPTAKLGAQHEDVSEAEPVPPMCLLCPTSIQIMQVPASQFGKF